MIATKQVSVSGGGSISAEALAGDFAGVKIQMPIWSIGCSVEGDGPAIGEIFVWMRQRFVVCSLGCQNWQGRSHFTGLAVVNA
jgi:hypothetical protein